LDEYERLTRVKEKKDLLEQWLEGGASNVSWFSPSGAAIRPGSDSKDVAVLLVKLTFGPGSEQGISKSLSDWTLVPGFSTSEYDVASRAKLVGEAARKEEGGLSQLTPKLPDEKGDQPSPLSDTIVIESYRGDSDTVEYFADAASWLFSSEDQRTEATLAFLIPATAQPEWYGLSCAPPKVTSSGAKASKNKDGLIKGRKGETAGLKWEVLDVTWAASVAAAKEPPAKGHELVVVKMKWTQPAAKDKGAATQVLVTANDLWLENTTLKKKYTARLREVLETKKGSDKATPKRVLSSRTADIKVEDQPAESKGEKYSEHLSEKWELFLQSGGYATLDLVFEVPMDHMSDNYTFGVSDTVSRETPQWYAERNMAVIRSSTHDLLRNSVSDKESIKLLKDEKTGQTIDYRPGTIGGQKLLCIAVNLQTRKKDDAGLYDVPLKKFTLKSSSDEPITLFAYRLEGEEAYRRYNVQEPASLRLKGTKELELIYQVSKETAGLKLTLEGFSRVIKVDE